MRRLAAAVSLVFSFSFSSFSQNFDKIGKAGMISVNGGLNYSSVIYNAQGIPARRQPFTWFLNGNIAVNILDISLPFTFNYSNNQTAYSQPFNIQSFNPSYKWIKGYAGITSMNFSPYTLSNHIFAGGGVELSPGPFRFALMTGRLNKAVEYDALSNSDASMSYRRMGYGASAGYEKNGHALRLIWFSAADDPASLHFIPVNTNVTPMKNTVISVSGKTNLYKKLKLEAEYALSGLTRDITVSDELGAAPKNRLPYLFRPNATSQFFSAVKASLGYNLKTASVNFNYERVDPDYKTLGAYYFNNDLENFTLAPSLNLLKGKLNLALNTGLQRNNLDRSKLSTTQRWVGSANASFMLDPHWNLMGSYSNFSSYTKQRPQDDPFYKNTLDTLNFYQLSQNALLSINYNFGNKVVKQALTLSGNYQVTGQNQGKLSDPGAFGIYGSIRIPSRVLNGNLGHSFTILKSKTSVTTALNANYSELSGLTNLYFGPNLNLSRAFVKNALHMSIGSSYNEVLINSIRSNEVFSHRFSLSYSPKLSNPKLGKMSVNLSAIYLQKLKTAANATAFNEFTGNIGLSYGF